MKTLAASPLVKESGMLPRRIVLRAALNDEGKPTEFVVHCEAFNDGRSSYCHGSYFPCPKSAALTMSAYEQAYACFVKRAGEMALGLEYQCLFGAEATAAREFEAAAV